MFRSSLHSFAQLVNRMALDLVGESFKLLAVKKRSLLTLFESKNAIVRMQTAWEHLRAIWTKLNFIAKLNV